MSKPKAPAPAELFGLVGRLWVGTMAIGHAASAHTTGGAPGLSGGDLACRDSWLKQGPPEQPPFGLQARWLCPRAPNRSLPFWAPPPEPPQAQSSRPKEVRSAWRLILARGEAVATWAQRFREEATVADAAPDKIAAAVLAQVAVVRAQADRAKAWVALSERRGFFSGRGQSSQWRPRESLVELRLAVRRAQAAMHTAAARREVRQTEQLARTRLGEVVTDWAAAVEEIARVGP